MQDRTWIDAPSSAEAARLRLWELTQQGMLRWFRFRRDVSIGSAVAPLVSLTRRVVVEIDRAGPHFHRQFDLDRVLELQQLGYKVIRFWEQDIVDHPEIVVDQLCRQCAARSQYVDRDEIDAGRMA